MNISTRDARISGLRDIAPDYDLILCDVWGVVHDGVTHAPAAADALTRFRATGGRVVLITNAPRPHPTIVPMLDRMGLPRAAYDAIVSSGDVTLDLIVARGAAPVCHLGPARDRSLFSDAEARLRRPLPLVGADSAEYVVCTGLFDDADPLDPYQPMLEAMRARDLTMICANPDIVVHVGDRLVYCAGALAENYEKLGGKAIQAGKPHAIIYETALRVAESLGAACARERTLAIGDGMFTDMAGAAAQGFDGLFISGGVHRADLHGPGGLDDAACRALARKAGAAPRAWLQALAW